MSKSPATSFRLVSAALALSFMAACNDGFDMDLRGGLGSGLDTTSAARTATVERPRPDNRGIISYPGYQVAVARRGDTLHDVSGRIGVPVDELARYNGVQPDAKLRNGEIIALPYRVAEPSAATGGTGVIRPPASDVDIASIAGSAIDKADTSVSTETLAPAKSQRPDRSTQTGPEPIRHKVKRGETAFTIARLYNVSVRALADWNGLGSDFTIRENQILLIPPADPDSEKQVASAAPETPSKPGQGSPTPTPPSASKPLPPETVVAVEKPKTPDLGASQSASKAPMGYPVEGKIIRPYKKNKNNGIDISAPAGTPVIAAADGKVVAISKDDGGVEFIVVRHADNVMTVYYNLEKVGISKGASVKRGQKLAELPAKDNFVHFEVRKGIESVDPMEYLQ